jgi:hypothetical protein
VANVSSISVEGENRDWTSLRFVGRSEEESTEGFAIGCRDRELFVVFDSVLRGPRDVCAGSWGDVAWVDDLAGEGVSVSCILMVAGACTFDSSIERRYRVRIVMSRRRMGIAPSPRGRSLC